MDMKRLIITEEEKDDILSKYSEANDDILRYIRRNYRAVEVPEYYISFLGKYKIMVDDKGIPVKNNVKRLVDLIDLEIIDKFPDVSDKVRRQTIKKYVKNFEE
jgi:hypothetical protein